ncbi:MAG: type II toxin-antitoxin system VapB family antitoxin [Pyrinomonadaceae bacterium]|nr:type II toxin-antitoxin system VapB family antitoxin [Pyrinomonadaceae bacterium]
MATNLEINEELMKNALEVSDHKTKKAVVNEALEEYVRRRKQVKIIDLFGKVRFDEAYDYKLQRSKK